MYESSELDRVGDTNIQVGGVDNEQSTTMRRPHGCCTPRVGTGWGGRAGRGVGGAGWGARILHGDDVSGKVLSVTRAVFWTVS